MLVPLEGRLTVLHRLVKNGVGAEIGVHNGDYSLSLLNIAKPRRLFLIDPWIASTDEKHSLSLYAGARITQSEMDKRHERVATRFAKQITEGKIVLVRRFSHEAAELIEKESLDFIYIDGDHNYQGVKADLANYWPKLKPKGLLICDDYTIGGWWKDGVTRAVHEFLPTANCKVDFVIDTQFCIRKLG